MAGPGEQDGARPDHGEKKLPRLRPPDGAARRSSPAAFPEWATAIAYAREGADVAISYFPAEEPDAQEVIALIEQAGRKAVAIPGDLRDEDFCKRLVACAMKSATGSTGSTSSRAMRAASRRVNPSSISPPKNSIATMKTNIYAPFWIIKAALPHLKPGAVIIGTTSEQTYDPSPDLYDYAQTKAATMNYVRSLAKQLGPKGLRANGVARGPIWTPLQISGGATMEKVEKFGGQTPLGRPGTGLDLCAARGSRR